MASNKLYTDNKPAIDSDQEEGSNLNLSAQISQLQLLSKPTTMTSKIRVQKRGQRGLEAVKFDKITERIANLCKGLDGSIDPSLIAIKTISNLYDGISTEELDRISAKIAESYKLAHPDYSTLAARILISNLHKTTPASFSKCMEGIVNKLSIASGRHYKFIADNAAALDNMVVHNSDYMFDFFGYKTLEQSYLIKISEPVLGTDGKPVYINHKGAATVPTYSARGKPVVKIGNRIYGLRVKTVDRVFDRPQYMYMRVAIALNIDHNIHNTSQWSLLETLENIKTTYKVLSQHWYTHATPTLFNACAKMQQLASCFLLGTDDSIEGIMHNLYNASIISKSAGGEGFHMSNIRSRDSIILGTNGKSSGLPPQLKMYNEAACSWNQGGRRKGAFAIYLEPWHGDIMQFLQMKLSQGSETERARDLFYALWVPDLVADRIEKGELLSLFSENTAPGLSDVYDGMEVCAVCNYCANGAYSKYCCGIDAPCEGTMKPTEEQSKCTHDFQPKNVFTELYTMYEEDGLAVAVIEAREVMDAITNMQRESGTPYICFKDHVNRTTNQKNIGTIKSSNLCTEIMEYSSSTSYATCTLASINLKKFLIPNTDARFPALKLMIDHNKLYEIVRIIVRNLDTVIDINQFPVIECVANARDYRPIGVGVQALADVFALMRIPFCGHEAEVIDLEIFETIYFAAVTESCEMAKTRGKYSAFEGSPASRGQLSPDLWTINQKRINSPLKDFNPISGRHDWLSLKANVIEYGLRNSVLIAPMPTVSTSQIMGNNESFEPFAANLYTKGTLAGKFTISNAAMIRHLIELGLWSEELKNKIIANDGSVQGIEIIPEDVRKIYLTVWEMKQVELIKRAASRLAFIDQSQSLNIHLTDNSDKMLRGVFLAGWKYGLKTGSYYIRTRAAAKAMKNNIAQTTQVSQTTQTDADGKPKEYSKAELSLLNYNKRELEREAEREKLTEVIRRPAFLAINEKLDYLIDIERNPAEISEEIMMAEHNESMEKDRKQAFEPEADDSNMVCKMEEGCISCGS